MEGSLRSLRVMSNHHSFSSFPATDNIVAYQTAAAIQYTDPLKIYYYRESGSNTCPASVRTSSRTNCRQVVPKFSFMQITPYAVFCSGIVTSLKD
jgi:hypothetical protein